MTDYYIFLTYYIIFPRSCQDDKYHFLSYICHFIRIKCNSKISFFYYSFSLSAGKAPIYGSFSCYSTKVCEYVPELVALFSKKIE